MRAQLALSLGLGCAACQVEPASGATAGDLDPSTSRGDGPASSGEETPTPDPDPDPAGTTTSGGPAPGSTGGAADGGSTADEGSDGRLLLDVASMPDSPPTREMCETAIDIVFVLDVSTSMDTVLTQLADEIEAVDQALAELDLAEDARYGLAVFVDDAALLGDGEPFATVPQLQQEFLDWAEWTAQGTQLAPAGFFNFTWPENSLDALHFAASDFAWRDAETTLRLVIHATDDTFWDGPTVQNGVEILHGYEETVEALQAAQARVYAFTADIGGECECEDVTPGWSEPYGAFASIPDATDGGRYDIEQIVGGAVSFTDAIAQAVQESYCTEYEPAG